MNPAIFHGVRIVNRPDYENTARLDNCAMPMIAEMMQTGMHVSRSYLGDLSKRLQGEMDQIGEQVYQLAGRRFNIASPEQMATVLFRDLGIKQAGKIKLTASGRESTDADVLEQLRFKHDVIPHILEWRKRAKLKGTYSDALPLLLDENDRLHTSIMSTRTDTGRLASKDPNLQNIPIRSELGKEIRNAFIPPPGKALGTVDWSQIEVRCHAHDSGCSALIDIYERADDVYWAVAELIFKRKFSAEDRANGKVGDLKFKEVFRFPAKTTTLGTLYDITPQGLLRQILISISEAYALKPDVAIKLASEWDEDRCAKMIAEFFGAFWEILERRGEHHRRAKLYQLVWDGWGRTRAIPQVRSVHKWIVQEGLRAAGNMPIQGFAGGIIKLAMGQVQEWLDRNVGGKWRKWGVKPLMPIHDELLFEGPKRVLEDFLQRIVQLARTQVPLDCPLDAGWGVSEESWGSLEH